MMKVTCFGIGMAVIVVMLLGCPMQQQPQPLTFHWDGGLYGSGCENNLSVYINDTDVIAGTFTLMRRNSEGKFVPTGVVHSAMYGTVENVTTYRVDATFQGNDVYWWDGAYYYWDRPFGCYRPVPWDWAVSHSLTGHLDAMIVVRQMTITHGDGSFLFATFEDLDPGDYRVEITGVQEQTNRRYDMATTDSFIVDACVPPNNCDATTVKILRTPLFGNSNGVTSGTVTCLDNPADWEVCVYARTNAFPDPYDLIGVASIAADGSWSQQGVQVINDQFASEFYVSVAPAGSNPPMSVQGIPQIPGEVATASVQRIPYVTFVGNPSVSAGANCRTNMDPDSFGALAYVMTSVGRVHQQPLVDPPDANTLVPLVLSADGTFCSFHIALNQTVQGSVHSDYVPSTATEVKVQILPLGYDYIDTENKVVHDLRLNLTSQGVVGHGVDVSATLP